jgi:hypothetical protein
MNFVLHWIQAHQTTSALAGAWLFSAAVSNLPMPKGEGFYSWAYGFFHSILSLLAANVKIPGLQKAAEVPPAGNKSE